MEVGNPSQIESLQRCLTRRIRDAAQRSLDELNALGPNPLDAFHRLRFDRCGFHPLEGHVLNLSEQLNQTFHALTTLAAAKLFLEWYPNCGGLFLNLTTGSGMDLQSKTPNFMAAEVLTAVHPKNNLKKVNADFKKVHGSGAQHQYIFYYVPSLTPGRQFALEKPEYDKLRVWALGRDEVLQTGRP